MLVTLEFELCLLINDRLDAAQAGQWARVKELDQQAAAKRAEIDQRQEQVKCLVGQLWPGVREG